MLRRFINRPITNISLDFRNLFKNQRVALKFREFSILGFSWGSRVGWKRKPIFSLFITESVGFLHLFPTRMQSSVDFSVNQLPWVNIFVSLCIFFPVIRNLYFLSSCLILLVSSILAINFTIINTQKKKCKYSVHQSHIQENKHSLFENDLAFLVWQKS